MRPSGVELVRLILLKNLNKIQSIVLEEDFWNYFSQEFLVRKMGSKDLITKNCVQWFYFLHIKAQSY